MDEFWFQTQRGFCAHYASALALALRVVGVPSRVIGGYQGGEWDEEAQFLQVRQYDAHAWVEYWHADKGWIRVDPTAAVAPHRIEQSFAQTLRAGQTQGAEAVLSWRLSNASWVSQIRRQWDQLEYLWHKRVLNYHQEQQLSLLKQWLGEVNWTALLIALMLAIVSFLALITLWQLKPWLQPKRAPEIKLYEALLKRLHQLGLRVSRHVPPSELEHHLQSLTDQQRYIVSQFVTCFLQLQYEQKPAHVGRKQWVLQQCHGMKQYLKQL